MSNEPSITELQAKIAELEAQKQKLLKCLSDFAYEGSGVSPYDIQFLQESPYGDYLFEMTQGGYEQIDLTLTDLVKARRVYEQVSGSQFPDRYDDGEDDDEENEDFED